MADEKTATEQSQTIPEEMASPIPTPVQEVAPAPIPIQTPQAPVSEALPVSAERPSFFVKPTDRHRIELDILYDRKTNLITSVSRVGLGVDFAKFGFFGHTVEWFEFSLPNYEDMSTYRQRCGTYRRDAGKVVVDETQLKNFLLVWHLKDWSMLDSDEKTVPLSFNQEGALDEESIKKVYGLPPALIETLLSNLEKDLILS